MKNVFSSTFKHLVFILSMTCMVVSCDKKDETADTVITTQTEQKSFQGDPQSIAALISAYQQAHKNERLDSFKLATVFNQFVNMMGSNKSFEGKKPCRIQPIYAAGVTGVAYHEIWFAKPDKTVEGWVLMSATEKDMPVVNYSHGTPYSAHLVDKAGAEGKVYRFGVSYYALEQNGQKTADYGQMPTTIGNPAATKNGNGGGDSKNLKAGSGDAKDEMKEGVDFFTINSYEELKQKYAQFYFTEKRRRVASEMYNQFFDDNSLKAIQTRDAYKYYWVAGTHGYYTQIPPYTGANNNSCYSGCTNNAWANIFAWWDGTGGKGALIPTTSTGETTPIYRNTWARRNSSDPVQMYSRSVSGTYCGGATGWTAVSNSMKGVQYVGAIGYGYTFYYQWCNNAGADANLANILTGGITEYHSPVSVGANSHNYIAIGCSQWDTNTKWTWAYCYPGWSEDGRDDVWVSWYDMLATVKLFVH
jgi:hypothetical protein